jgi:hypothetical protein
MSKLEKLIEKAVNNPKEVRFEELDKIISTYGFIKRQSRSGTSHYCYSLGSINFSIPFKKPFVKTIYVERVMKIIKELKENGQ